MTPKEYLLTLKQYAARYRRAIEDVAMIRTMAEGVKAIRYDKENVQASADPDRFAQYMARLDAAERKVERIGEEYLDRYETIRRQIDMVSPQMYSDVLYLRYVSGMKLWDVAQECNFTYSYTKHLHGRALAEFGRLFGPFEK